MSLASATVGAARRAARALLSEASGTAALDADLLLSEALSLDRGMLELIESTELSADQEESFKHLLQRRMAGEPVAYITGSKAFWTIDLKVSSATLVPRPETELVVERALHHCRSRHNPMIADLGTGSGCIAFALADELPHALITATDLSNEALEVAERNRAALGLGNVEFRRGCWTEALPNRQFDVIAANPPYIADNDPCLKNRFMQFEPQIALNGGREGFESIQSILMGVREFLKPGGWLVIEHGCSQGSSVRERFAASGFNDCETYQDLAGLDRVTEGCNA